LNAGAESNDDDSIEALVQSPDVLTLHIQPNANATVLLNGTTLKLETYYTTNAAADCSVNCPEGWIQTTAAIVFDMNCVDGTNLSSWVTLTYGYLPAIGGTECEIIFNPDNTGKETILIFTAHSVTALETVNQ
jgi:hypothetical protein